MNTYDICSDGSYTVDEYFMIRLNTERAVQQNAQFPLRYSRSMERVNVVEAVTVTASGERISVPPDGMIIQQSMQSAVAPMYDDGEVLSIIFPAANVGALMTLRYRRERHRPMFAGHFSALEVFHTSIDYESAVLSVRAPAEMHLHFEAIDIDGGRQTDAAPGQQHWQWTLGKQEAEHVSPFAPADNDVSPRVAMTSFDDYDAVATSYRLNAQAAGAVTETIRELAEQITRGVEERRVQAEVLYHWVCANIRYVAVHYAEGGVVPHAADSVLLNRYGDCKDQVVLLEALLAAKGIASSAVLVNSENTYWMPSVAAPLPIFNHAVTWLPEWDCFLDSTAGLAAFGVLPPPLLGKIALVIDRGDGRGELRRLPVAGPETDRIDIVTRLVLEPDETVRGNSEIVSIGVYSFSARQTFAALAPGMGPEMAAQWLTVSGESGEGDYQFTSAFDLATPFHYVAHFILPEYTPLPGPAGMPVPTGLGSVDGVVSMLYQFSQPTRTRALIFHARRITETIDFELPPALKFTVAPASEEIVDKSGWYRSTIHVDGNMVHIRRELVIDLQGPLIEPADYQAVRRFIQSIKRSQRAQFIIDWLSLTVGAESSPTSFGSIAGQFRTFTCLFNYRRGRFRGH